MSRSRRLPPRHVYEDLADVAQRADAYAAAPEAERVAAIAELTRRRTAFSATFASTVAALVIAAIVGLAAAYSSYLAMYASTVSEIRASAVELAEFFDSHESWEAAKQARQAADTALGTMFDVTLTAPWVLVIVLLTSGLVVYWATWVSRRGSIAAAWLAAYALAEKELRAAQRAAVSTSRRRGWLRRVLR